MRDARCYRVRTTLDIDDDVLEAAKELAANRQTSAGKVLSELARRGLEAPAGSEAVRNGVPVVRRRPPGSPVPTLDLVNRLRDDDGR
jgi:hypothetical protein